ncbi:MAG: histidine kinase, partial [Ilumatobacteraceae bacterium]|nr:histidine kinase [Ilumatobacteraceae bacterium]
MSRSVLIRLVAVSLVVATCSIAATAWLTTTSTTAKFTGDLKRTLEIDNNIYDALLDYSGSHASWDGVQTVIDSFAPTTDRTITLATADGTVIASSDPQHPDRMPTDDVAAALVDPLARSSGMPDQTSLNDVPPSVLPSKNEPADAAPVAVPQPLPQSDTHLLVPTYDPTLPSAVFALNSTEAAVRSKATTAASQCASRIGAEVRIVTGQFGGFSMESTDGNDDVLLKLESCVGVETDPPGQRYIAINSAITDSVADCLGRQGIEPIEQDTKTGLRSLLVRTAIEAADSPARVCRTAAVHSAMASYVAPAAQLYLTSQPVSSSWLSSAGGTKIIVALIIVLLVTLVAAALGARRLLRPIRSLTRAAQRMATGDLKARVNVRGSDEIARLGTAFNSMADAVEANEQQRKMLVGDVAHELRNPLANVRGYLEAAQDRLVRMDDQLVDSLLEETMQLQHLIDDLQDLALADAGRLRMHPETTDVVDLVARLVTSHQASAESAGIAMTMAAAPRADLWVDSVRIKQAVSNLITNAIRY